MTEHEKLKEICDIIWFKEFNYWDECWNSFCEISDDNEYREINVREIIFTPEFMEKFISYCDIKWIIAPSYYKIFLIDLHKNLYNPVDYLYNLIKE